MEPKMKKYRVVLDRVEYYTTTVEVEACSEDEARSTAMDEACFDEISNAEQDVAFIEEVE